MNRSLQKLISITTLILLGLVLPPAIGFSQSITVSSSVLPNSNVVHISVTGTYSNGSTYTVGFYNNNQVMDDTSRVSSYGSHLSTTSATDTQVSNTYNAMTTYAANNTYNNTGANCGSAVDYAVGSHGANAPALQGTFSYNTIAIVGTAINTIEGYVESAFSSAYSGFCAMISSFFE
jgi:hypothetical protein